MNVITFTYVFRIFTIVVSNIPEFCDKYVYFLLLLCLLILKIFVLWFFFYGKICVRSRKRFLRVEKCFETSVFVNSVSNTLFWPRRWPLSFYSGRIVHGIDGRCHIHVFGNRQASVHWTYVTHGFTDVRIHEKSTARVRRAVDVHVRHRRNVYGLVEIGWVFRLQFTARFDHVRRWNISSTMVSL